jgi:hypothetical protein
MSPEYQRVTIAEACGWKLSPPNLEYKWLNPDTKWSEPELPDYLNDLNAMHGAEKVLFCDKWKWLAYVNNLNEMPSLQDEWLFASIHATAAQRAEAFLKTLNLWDNNK